MEKHDNQEIFSIRDFEGKGQELIHIMLELCEKRIHAAPQGLSPVGDSMIEAALTVKASIRTFIFIERLPDE